MTTTNNATDNMVSYSPRRGRDGMLPSERLAWKAALAKLDRHPNVSVPAQKTPAELHPSRGAR